MDLSIIILKYKQQKIFQLCLENLIKAKINLDYEIIIIDNNSQDNSFEYLEKIKKDYPEIEIVLNDKNSGYAKANNQAVKQAKGDYVLIFNPDVIVSPGAIEEMLAFLKKNDDIGLIAPQLLNQDKIIQFSCYRFPKLITPAIRRTFLYRLPWFKNELKRYLMQDFNHQEIREVDWLIGACLMIKKDFLKEIGYFDERYFLYFEDVDLAKKVWQARKKVVYFPKAKMVHFHRRLSADFLFFPSLFRKITWIHIFSALKYFWKWRGK